MRRSVATALGIVCITLVAALGVVTFMGYSPTATNSVPSLQSEINQLQTWLDGNKTLLSQTQTWLEGNKTDYFDLYFLQSEIASLNSTYNDYVTIHQHTNSEYEAVWIPLLISMDLQGSDNRPYLQTPYLHVAGYVVNVHQNWAYNSRLHVVAYQGGGVTVIDTYISLGTIAGQSYYKVASNVYYTGSSLTSWTITPEWTANP